jgi:hypothetical protein
MEGQFTSLGTASSITLVEFSKLIIADPENACVYLNEEFFS